MLSLNVPKGMGNLKAALNGIKRGPYGITAVALQTGMAVSAREHTRCPFYQGQNFFMDKSSPCVLHASPAIRSFPCEPPL